jgi:hypothetical protein
MRNGWKVRQSRDLRVAKKGTIFYAILLNFDKGKRKEI